MEEHLCADGCPPEIIYSVKNNSKIAILKLTIQKEVCGHLACVKQRSVYSLSDSEIENIIHQMLSTFRFIETESDELTLEEIKNAEYYISSYEEKVTLKNGQYFKQFPDSASGLSVMIYNDKIALGDLNDDKKEDAVVVLTSSGGGSGNFRELAIIINKDGKPFYLTSKDLGDRVIINSIYIESRIITLDMIIHGPEDGMCCPSVPKIFKYKLSGDQIVEVEDETADWKTYRNETYGYETKCPQDWLVQDSVFIDPVNRQDFVNKGIEPLTGAKFTSLGDPSLTVSLTVHNNHNNYTLEEWLRVYQENSPTGVSLGWKKDFLIAGEKGLKGGFGCCMTYHETAFLAKGNKVYQLGEGVRNLQTGNYENETIFNQILSTFRFLD